MKELSQQQISHLKKKGFTDEMIHQQLKELEEEEILNQGQAYDYADPQEQASQSMFEGMDQDNLIKWQLELDSILERTEHILKNDKVSYVKGQLIYLSCKDKQRILNDEAVNEIMKCLTLYLNRNTILSNYSEEMINEKVYDFGIELSDLIFMKYDSFGMDTTEKRKIYPMLIRQMVDIVHSAYLRAANGGERSSIRQVMSVGQTENVSPMGQMAAQMPGERSMLNPMRYIMGRYK